MTNGTPSQVAVAATNGRRAKKQQLTSTSMSSSQELGHDSEQELTFVQKLERKRAHRLLQQGNFQNSRALMSFECLTSFPADPLRPILLRPPRSDDDDDDLKSQSHTDKLSQRLLSATRFGVSVKGKDRNKASLISDRSLEKPSAPDIVLPSITQGLAIDRMEKTKRTADREKRALLAAQKKNVDRLASLNKSEGNYGTFKEFR